MAPTAYQDKTMNNLKLTAALLAVMTSAAGMAQQNNLDLTDEEVDQLEEILVLGRSVTLNSSNIDVEKEMVVDTSMVLKRLPGSDVNINGRVTGIAQHRGMYGDRVSVSIDDLGMISGGPNAMDTPLSYVSPMITEKLTVQRGIASVSSASESIGGHINATLARGQFGDSENFGLDGLLGTRYSGNGNTSTTAARVSATNLNHRFSLLAQSDRADDLATPAGKITPSGLNRDRFDVSYAFSSDGTELLAFAGKLDTQDSGTPALAMDIGSIDTMIYGLQGRTSFSEEFAIEAKLAYNDVEHWMDNFSLRQPPPNTMGYRQNYATGSGSVFSLAGIVGLADSELSIGVDGRLAEHSSVITNPENPMFNIDNFVAVQRDLTGLFVEWKKSGEISDWEFGVRYNSVSTDAGEVGVTGVMGDSAQDLADDFNAAKRNLRFENVDAVARYRRSLTQNVQLRLELGSKARAPSYQELYLWLPLQATGGLADGRNYIGNLELDAERSNEINVGLGWTNGAFQFSPQIYYKDVSDYIQGVPSTNMAANMLAMMMSGEPALQFENVDARIYGVDLAWQYAVSDAVYLDGIGSYTRGERSDISDNLYRLAPPKASLGISYVADSWTLRSEVVGYARQDKVSAFNDELPTPGYGLMNLSLNLTPHQSLRLELQVHNLFDKTYQDHLAGINRVNGSDIPVGERLFGPERSISAGVIYRF
ncbi:MAG: TonB-dependent receptor [Gammaproteobacteria bacterium]|nr:MAG: TonB-dependent receptor [Gammaproteobacteria bacterium]